MNSKIPFHELAALLASKAGTDTQRAEAFVKAFFDRVAAGLTDEKTVAVKGFGTFTLTGVPENPVTFRPDAEMAEKVNAPFALFEGQEVGEDVTDRSLEAAILSTEEEEITEPVTVAELTPVAEPETAPEPTVEPTVETTITAEIEPTPEPVPEPVSKPEPATEPEAAPEPEPAAEPEPEPAADTEPAAAPLPAQTPTPVEESHTEAVSPVIATPPAKPTPAPVTPAPVTPVAELPEEEEEYITPDEEKKSGFGTGFLVGLLCGLAIGACAAYFAIDFLFPSASSLRPSEESVSETVEIIDTPTEVIEAPVAAPVDTTATAQEQETTAVATAPTPPVAETAPATKPEPEPKPAAPKAAPVKDTVKAGYLLVNMARKHYGNKDFWVYIYEENKAAIGNPNRVRPGMVLVIPPAEKYSIDANSKSSLEAARRKAGQILAKYPN